MNRADYNRLCDKESTLILQKIICPYCGYVYDQDTSIDVGLGDDCEDTVKINCAGCGKKLIVYSDVTQVLFRTLKGEQDAEN